MACKQTFKHFVKKEKNNIIIFILELSVHLKEHMFESP